MTTLKVAVQGRPAFGATSAAAMVMFRSFAVAAGATTRAASTARTLSLRIVPPWSACLHRLRGSGSAGGARGAPPEDGDPPAAQLEQHGGGVVPERALAQDMVGVGPVHEDEPTAEAGDVDRLALLERDVVVAEPGRDPLSDRSRARPAARALARP